MTIDDSICEKCLAKNHCDVLQCSNNCNEVRAMAEHDKEIYNKAIDDFVKLVHKHDWNIRNINENSFIYGAIDTLAEQLKAGERNERSI